MSDDAISREAALEALDWGDIYGRNAQQAIRALPALDLTPQPDEAEKWKRAFAAQSRKLQAVLHIPGVKEALAVMEGEP